MIIIIITVMMLIKKYILEFVPKKNNYMHQTLRTIHCTTKCTYICHFKKQIFLHKFNAMML